MCIISHGYILDKEIENLLIVMISELRKLQNTRLKGEALENDIKWKTMFNTVTIHANYQSFWHNRHKKWKQKGVEGVSSSLQLTQHENLAKTTIYQNNNSEKLFLNSNDRVSVVVDLSISKQTDAHWAIWWHFIKINENRAIVHSQSFEVCISNSGGGNDHIYRMVIVEGRCTMARSSSLGANCSLVDTKV